MRSMVVIFAVALAIAAIRDGGINWSKAAQVLASNRSLLVMVFLGLWVWEHWSLKTRRNRGVGQSGSH
ncbi:MAG: hypothetical protein ACREH8_05950 [Opitutaceae bacterium]